MSLDVGPKRPDLILPVCDVAFKLALESVVDVLADVHVVALHQRFRVNFCVCVCVCVLPESSSATSYSSDFNKRLLSSYICKFRNRPRHGEMRRSSN